MTKDLVVTPLKLIAAFCPETLLKNLGLDIGKKFLKIKTNCLLTVVCAFDESNLE